MNERTEESVIQWFGRIERIRSFRNAERVYEGECMGSRSVGQLRKCWIDAVNERLKKICLDVGQSRSMVHDRNEW